MRWLVLVAVLLLVTACNVGLSGPDWDTEFLDGPRVDLDPGQSLHLPLLLEAPGGGEVQMTVTAAVVSHGPTVAVLPEVDLEAASGEVIRDPDNPLSVRCIGDCRGEHGVTFTLSEGALGPLTVGLSVHARREGRGLVLEAGPPLNSSVWLISDPTLTETHEVSAGRLHVTSPVEPRGELRLEVPASDVHIDSRTVIVGDSSSVSEVAPATSLSLPAPDGACGGLLCDWSLQVAAVVPWQVAATSSEFDVSFTPDDGLVAGRGSWIGKVGAGETMDLQLEVVAPPGEGTALSVAVSTGFPSEPRLPDPGVVVSFGAREIAHEQATSESTRVFVPLVCDPDRCRGSMPVSIDATTRETDLDLELRMNAVQARLAPVEGEIELGLRP